ncbi:MAG: uroporphyrinogen decarboxylase family protein [Anaerolineae bacterium]
MDSRSELLRRLRGEPSSTPLYLPDLLLWHEGQLRQGTLPQEWADGTLADVARAMGVPVWMPARPWRIETPGVQVTLVEGDERRVVRAETSAGILEAHWSLGPDGDWWQDDYPVKSAADLPAALELVRSRTYVLEPGRLPILSQEVGDDGILALELPRRPYADLLHELLGWSDGLIFLVEEEDAIQQLLDILEDKLQNLVEQIAPLPGDLVISPDNLDGQYISPTAFARYLAGSYRISAEVLHRHARPFFVHAGGPIRRILPALAASGVDGVEGIAGPPQGDLTLAAAREMVGPDMVLWGGIPQDALLAMYDRAAFEEAVRQAAREAQSDPRLWLGVADRVPVDAEPDRLAALPDLVAQATGRDASPRPG